MINKPSVEHMGDITRNLVSCFFSECEKQFRFLEQRHEFVALSGLAEYKNGRQIITPYTSQAIEGSFWAVVRYEHKNLTLEIVYGDRDYVLEGYMYYNQIQRLHLSEIMQAARKDAEGVEQHNWVMHEQDIQEKIEMLSASVKKHKRYFLKYNDKLIERATVMRAKRLQKMITEHYKQNMGYISLMSAKAFQEKDYKRVIELLRPHEGYLEPTDLKKLDLAKKKLLNA